MTAKMKGFSLIEIMVVVVIIGMLMAAVAPKILIQKDTAMIKRVQMDMASIETALKMYKLEYHKYPNSEEGFDVLVNPPKKSHHVDKDGFLPALPKDPWENPYVYHSPGDGTPYDIVSLGEDGIHGGEGLSSDIVNWRFK